MPEIGIRELKAQVSEVIRTVNEKRGSYVVTRHGRPVAVLMPLDTPQAHPQAAPSDSAWETLTRLGEEIGKGWQADESSAEILSAMRH